MVVWKVVMMADKRVEKMVALTVAEMVVMKVVLMAAEMVDLMVDVRVA